ncbi:mucin-6-like [Salminus brasiliensis]|uniref:mucin-6-like n=1 Tax=Salminus brasiliensis TaxID=930266 RepID=UPI003B82F982
MGEDRLCCGPVSFPKVPGTLSPDLNPFEKLWAELQRRVHRRGPRTLNKFCARFEDPDNTPSPQHQIHPSTWKRTPQFDTSRSKEDPQEDQPPAGPDKIPGWVLRECADQISEVLADIFNISLIQAAVPTCLMTATIIPVLKSSAVTDLNDYWTIALTPIRILHPPNQKNMQEQQQKAGAPDVCKTFGSGVIQTFNKSMFYLKSTCPFTLTRFTLSGVDCGITVQRNETGLISRVEISVNKITTILQDGKVTVEGNSISLPFDHTYQLVYQYGVFIKLRSKVLPFSVIWRSHPDSISSLWVELDHELMDGMTGMCGRLNSTETIDKLISASVMSDGKCLTGDAESQRPQHYNFMDSPGLSNYAINAKITNLPAALPTCPGEMKYHELGPAFPPTCTNPEPPSGPLISTCLPPSGMVLNDRADGFLCINIQECLCVHGGKTYPPGAERNSKCQSCVCVQGKWNCSANVCPPTCNMEGRFVTTFDGKQYRVPGKCTYVAASGTNWTVTVRYSDTDASIAEMHLDVSKDKYTFSTNSVKRGQDEITDLSQTDHTMVFWQSSMFVQVQTYFGMKIKVQVSPEIQLYLYLPPSEQTRGLCGIYNNDTEDDFTTSSGIVENAALPFTQSWTIGQCSPPNTDLCINTDNEKFAEQKCSQLRNTSSAFARCHDYVPVSSFFDACVQRTCKCTSGVQNCLCVALSNYAKACASQGIDIGDWRAESACSVTCSGNLRFSYIMSACNHTCRSLTGPDPTCDAVADPVEGCGCLAGTHLNTPQECSSSALCVCHYQGGTTPPGPVVIDGRQCLCEHGVLRCSQACDCPQGKICVHCAQAAVNTSRRTCESLSKPSSVEETCSSGCYCPAGLIENHSGGCVTQDNCTCKFSGSVYASGQTVVTNCKKCTCRAGQWHCEGEPCPGVCEVFGNGQYNTFDSKWYRFDGNCQYTLVEVSNTDDHGLFAVRVESVPCCDEALTCSRSILVDLQDVVTLTLRDMNVTQTLKAGWHLQAKPLYSVHTVGLYIIISVPDLGLTVIWDKHTRVTIVLQARWKGNVRGLCGNYDGVVTNDLLTRSSSLVFSTLEFGNSWKTAVPPCSDVTQEVFPCERHSYCEAWAQRRCMILRGDTFTDCHLKVDPAPYYQACILESCSCEFEGRFLGFCTAVAAYAEACTAQNACINWRTPDLCPVYCDYYNEERENGWHYEPCGWIKTCGKTHSFTGSLEGCYPRCPVEAPYFDENTRKCSSLDRCTCFFNNTVVNPGDEVRTSSECCTTEEPETTTPLTTTSPVTTVTITTTERPSTTILTTPLTTTSPVTTVTITTTTEIPSTTTTPPVITGPTLIMSTSHQHTEICRDPLRNQSWSSGAVWTEDCFHKTCKNSIIEMRPVICPTLAPPVCPRDLKRVVKDEQGCCKTWKCDCQCDLYGDPHYVSFSGTRFNFLDNCTYTLVKEKNPRHQLSITVDNYFSYPRLFGSSVKGIILKYHNDTVTLRVNDDYKRVEAFLNQIPVQPPYKQNGIRFESTNYQVFVYLDQIRSHVSLDPENTLQITLAMEYFLNNTVGQCGVCGGPSCVRRNGQVEKENCCERTAYDWIEEDPLKPYCSHAPKNKPCTPPPSTPAPICNAPLCDLLTHKVFRECSQSVDVETLLRNCRLDYCIVKTNSSICSSLRHLSEQCQRLGVCVHWRNLTMGICDVPCPEGMVFDECRSTPNDVCKGGVRVPGNFGTDSMRSGCFCPNNQSLAEEYKTKCVSECTNCKGPLGEPMPVGAIWESNCHICRCNNQTLTEECSPMRPSPTPICSEDSTPVSGCCNNQICVKKTCEYNGKTYKVGDTWRDPSQPCVTFSCTRTGTEIKRSVCPEQSCSELVLTSTPGNVTCAVRVSNMTVTVEGCTQEVKIPSCEGHCPSNSMWVRSGELEPDRRCCRKKRSETRMLSLSCNGAAPTQYTYNHILSCECQSDI